MRPRVAADDMTSPRELAQIVYRDESASPNVIGRDEEISAQLVPLQHVCRPQRAHASVVEGDREFVSQMKMPPSSDGDEVGLERFGGHIVECCVASGTAAGVVCSCWHHVVVHQ